MLRSVNMKSLTSNADIIEQCEGRIALIPQNVYKSEMARDTACPKTRNKVENKNE